MAEFVKGLDFLIKVNTGTDVAPVWTAVGGQRGATLNRTSDTVETTFKGNGGFKTYAQSFKEWSVDADGIVVLNDAGYKAIEDAYMSGELVKIELSSANGRKYKGDMIVSDFPVEMPYDDMMTYSLTLMGASELEIEEA